MKPEPKIIITPKSIFVCIGKNKRTFLKDSREYASVQKLILAENWDGLEEIITKEELAKALDLKIQEGKAVTQEGKPAHKTLEEKLSDGYPREVLQAFKASCDKNVWPRAVDDLLAFLKDRSLPLTKRGTFLGWKSINLDFTDHRTASINNRPGARPKMKRDLCEPSRQTGCGRGFHVGTYEYASNFAGAPRLIVVEVKPSAVTSVPLDSNERKLRCDEYKVLAEFPQIGNPTEFIAKLAERSTAEAPETFVRRVASKTPLPPEKVVEPTRKEILEYALHLKSTKKGDNYTARMVASKFKTGLAVLKDIATNAKNPSRINNATRAILLKVLATV